MNARKWVIVDIAIPSILALLGLGVAAMSTNPPFHIPSWVPVAFFVAAGIMTLGLNIFLFRSRREKPSIVVKPINEQDINYLEVKNIDGDGVFDAQIQILKMGDTSIQRWPYLLCWGITKDKVSTIRTNDSDRLIIARTNLDRLELCRFRTGGKGEWTQSFPIPNSLENVQVRFNVIDYPFTMQVIINAKGGLKCGKPFAAEYKLDVNGLEESISHKGDSQS